MPRSAPRPDRTRPTIEDVALAAGVSVATVSRALRGLPNVAPSTRDRVSRIARELDYRPDPAASRLATGRSRVIGLVVPLLNSWYFAQVASGAEAVCTEQGYDVMVLGTPDTRSRRALFDQAGTLHRRVDGLILVDVPLTDDDADELVARGLAVVTIGHDTDRFPSLGIDDTTVAELAVDHLVGLGHRRIALLGGQPDDPLGFEVPHHRRDGYANALRRAGIDPDPALRVSGNFSVLGGRDATQVLLALPDPPTAIFAMSDEMAFGALLAARHAGFSVPRDLSVVGVDDHDVSVVVGLTTVRQQIADHGATAARLVIDQLLRGRVGGDAELVSHRIERPVELVIRDTTGPAPDRARSTGRHRARTTDYQA